jgi:hypothetical protein
LRERSFARLAPMSLVGIAMQHKQSGCGKHTTNSPDSADKVTARLAATGCMGALARRTTAVQQSDQPHEGLSAGDDGSLAVRSPMIQEAMRTPRGGPCRRRRDQWTRLIPLRSVVTAAAGSPHTIACRSALRRPRSLKVRGWPVSGSFTVTPVRKSDSDASEPGKRGPTCRKDVRVSSNEWHPLQVLSAK